MRSAPAEQAPTRRRIALGGAAAVLLLVALLVWRCQAEPYVAEPSEHKAGAVADPAAAAATLTDLQRALRSGDRSAAAALGSGDAAALLRDAAANVASLDLADVGLRYVTESGSGEDDWSAAVEVTWRLRGMDGATAARGEVSFGFAGDDARITSVGSADGLTPLWLQGRVRSSRAGDALVLTTGPARALPAYLRQARTAVAATRTMLGGRPRMVVEVPSSAAQLDRAVGAEAGTYQSIAAVTTSADGTLAPGTPLHVFVNPEVYGGLGPVAAQVVMSHEEVHVATGAPFAQNVPLWLLEGFADFVALHDVDLPLTRTAGQIIERVRRNGAPGALPTRADFDAESSHLGATYEAAWLVCVTLAERGGDDAVVGLYRALLDGGDLAEQLDQRFGWTEAQLTAAWQQRLRALAG